MQVQNSVFSAISHFPWHSVELSMCPHVDPVELPLQGHFFKSAPQTIKMWMPQRIAKTIILLAITNLQNSN